MKYAELWYTLNGCGEKEEPKKAEEVFADTAALIKAVKTVQAEMALANLAALSDLLGEGKISLFISPLPEPVMMTGWVNEVEEVKEEDEENGIPFTRITRTVKKVYEF